jgi:hypothetical protein
MERPLRACALIALSGVLASCTNLGIFEDVGADPHPPQVQLLGVGYQPVTPTTTEPKTLFASVRAAATQFFPPDGFEVRPFDPAASTLVFKVQYSDVGGDMEKVSIRDLDGTLDASLGPPAPEAVDIDNDGTPDTQPAPVYFVGSSGIAELNGVLFPPGVEGPHRLELWAVDSHGSRSPKVTFTVNVVI